MKMSILTILVMAGMPIVPLAIDYQTPQSSKYCGHQAQYPGQTKPQAKPKWRAATFRGLKMGRSSLAEALRVFGKPKWSGPEADQDQRDSNLILYYSFDKGGEFPGELAVLVDKKSKKVRQIRNAPQNSLSKEEAIRHFGPGYEIATYEFCPGGDTTTAPIYPDPYGQLARIEYRERGIVLFLDRDGLVIEIAYVKEIHTLSSKEDCKRWMRKNARRL